MSLPSDLLATPITARKLARLGVERSELVLRPAFFRQLGVPYHAVATASCPLQEHPAPQADCTCGFYAVSTDEELWRLGEDQPDLVVVDVELAGRVIEHEHGYRASDQRATAVWLHATCVRCGRPAVTLHHRWFGSVVPACARCARRPLEAAAVDTALGVPVRFADEAIPRSSWRRRFAVVALQLAIPLVALVVAATLAVAWGSAAALAVGQLVILGWLGAGMSTLRPVATRLGLAPREIVRLQRRWGPLVFAVIVGCEALLTIVVIALHRTIVG